MFSHSTPPTHISRHISVASRMTLYLLAQHGPFSFVFRDRQNQTFRVSIGRTIQCSCQTTLEEHCLHSIYVMTRVFNVPSDNPMVWQNSYDEEEMREILRFTGRRGIMVGQQDELDVSSMSSVSLDQPQPQPQKKAIRMAMGKDSICPICQQPMSQNPPKTQTPSKSSKSPLLPSTLTTYCKVKCGNNFHLKCVKIWVQHKVTTNTTVSCPMCRCDWGRGVLEELRDEEKGGGGRTRANKKVVVRKRQEGWGCDACGKKKMKEFVYRCVVCEEVCLCEVCYEGNRHIEHQFIVRENGQWHGAHQRQQKSRNSIQRRPNQTQQLINRINQISLQPQKLYDFLASTYPYISKQLGDDLDRLGQFHDFDSDPRNAKCMICGSPNLQFLRRLPCGHFIDHNCLKECISQGIFECLKDGSGFLVGYRNLVRRMEEEAEGGDGDGGWDGGRESSSRDRMRYSSMERRQERSSRNQRMYNFDSYANRIEHQEEITLADILGNVQQILQQAPNTDRFRQRISSNIIHQQQNPFNRIRIRNVSNTPHRQQQSTTTSTAQQHLFSPQPQPHRRISQPPAHLPPPFSFHQPQPHSRASVQQILRLRLART